MKKLRKNDLKQVLGQLPFVPEMEWFLRRRDKPVAGFKLPELNEVLPDWHAQVSASPYLDKPGRKVLVVGMFRYWIQHAALVGMTLAGMGHEVHFGFLPYQNWFNPVNDYDLRQQNLYGKRVLRQAEPHMKVFSWLEVQPKDELPPELEKPLADLSYRDTLYTEQLEDVPDDHPLYNFRLERNTYAAKVALRWLEENKPDAVLVPNGWVLEFSAIHDAAKYLGIPAISYEFGEQKDRTWVSRNSAVMLQDTTEMWEEVKDLTLQDAQYERVTELYAHRRGGDLWKNFFRKWQPTAQEGAETVRAKMGLDGRPLVLMATNVIGDSLTLGREVFSGTMTNWIKDSLEYFAPKTNLQVVIRAHPGETIVQGKSVADVVDEVMPELPEHIHVVPAEGDVNTYDLVAMADLGMTYTTTVGMEMAMSGVPTIVAAKTHYRGRGFTIDPTTWEEFHAQLDAVVNDFKGHRLSEEQMRRAWHYAYRFFFNYPQTFPWHLRGFWDSLEEWPISRVLSEEGQERYGKTFDYLSGAPIPWASLD